MKEGITADAFVAKLSEYDVISFDIFDTLIFRPFSEPTDLFYLLGERLGVMNFKALREQVEKRAREKSCLAKGHCEVSLDDIWAELEQEIGVSAEQGRAGQSS